MTLFRISPYTDCMIYGNCVECSFPILVRDTCKTVTCPYCATANQPVGGITTLSDNGRVILVAVLAAGLVIGLFMGKGKGGRK